MIPREVLEILERPQVQIVSIVYDHGAGPRFDLYKKERSNMPEVLKGKINVGLSVNGAEVPKEITDIIIRSIEAAREIPIEEFDAACRAGKIEEPMIQDGSKIAVYQTEWTVTGILSGERVKATKPAAK